MLFSFSPGSDGPALEQFDLSVDTTRLGLAEKNRAMAAKQQTQKKKLSATLVLLLLYSYAKANKVEVRSKKKENPPSEGEAVYTGVEGLKTSRSNEGRFVKAAEQQS